MDERIAWRCPCGNALSAPRGWTGRPVRCPACGAGLPVPARGDPGVAPETRRFEDRLQERRAPSPAPSGAPYGAWEMRAEGGPADDDPFFQRFRDDPRTRRRAALRRFLPLAVTVALVAALAGGTVLSRHLWKTRWSAAARMERRGFGDRLEKGQRTVPRWQALAREVEGAERRHADQPGDREAAVALRDAYRLALQEECEMPAPRQVHLLNNAAWFLATAPQEDLREPSRAVILARQAVDLSGRKAAHVLDTLAQALFVDGRPGEAAAVEDEALALEPGSAFYRDQAARFRAAAGLPPLPPPAVPGPDLPRGDGPP